MERLLRADPVQEVPSIGDTIIARIFAWEAGAEK
jgi:hypothetical protein